VILFCSSRHVEHNSENRIDELDAKVNADVDSMYVKRIDIDDLMSYVYIVRVNYHRIQV
jgi:hypothetical protein